MAKLLEAFCNKIALLGRTWILYTDFMKHIGSYCRISIKMFVGLAEALLHFFINLYFSKNKLLLKSNFHNLQKIFAKLEFFTVLFEKLLRFFQLVF